MIAGAGIEDLPSLPRDDGGPVFAEPWQAQAFALAVSLHQAGIFEWREWSQALGAAIADAQGAGDADLGDTYYLHWLDALEQLCRDKTGLTPEQLLAQKERWRRAFINTPHGKPIELSAAD